MNIKKSERLLKVLWLFVICALVIALTAVISACSNKPGADKINDNNAENVNSYDDRLGEVTVEVDIKIEPDLPEINFGDYEFKIITSDYLLDANMPREIGAEEANGDSIIDAIYSRNKKIEEQYGVVIKEILHDRDNINVPVKKAVLADDGSYDLI